ncbi:PEP/pyruvate-binding domain-containing protein [Psychrobacillus sp. FSL H8-0510]|uniref:PEP/pyruvate-binding domain-containing protein n=1 Tax=Psychrobacillus sp. FSL H8-0510 TaxID=2921394 RepID=UPI0030FAEBEF
MVNAEEKNKNKIGNKSFNLKKLETMDLRIPKFITLTTSYLKEITYSELVLLANDLQTTIPSENGWAIRSSSIAEDTNNVSKAGKYKTIIINHPNNLPSAVYEVIGSNDSIQEEMAVIIQAFVEADYSGVVFSCNPISNQEDIVIELGEGRGENIVGGLVNPYIFKENKWNNTPQKLKVEVVEEIVSTVKRVKSEFVNEIDMEFCIKDNDIYWLQVRPVTTSFKKYKYEDIEKIRQKLSGKWFLLDQCTEPVAPLIQELDPAGLFKSRQWDTIFFDNYPYIQMLNNISDTTSNSFTDVKKDWETIKSTFEPFFDNLLEKEILTHTQKELWVELLQVRKVFREFTNVYMDRNWMMERRKASGKIIDFIKLANGENTNIDYHLSSLSTELGTLTSLKIEALNKVLIDVKRNINQDLEYFLNNSINFINFLKEFGYEVPYPVSIHLHTLSEKPDILLDRVKKMINSNFTSSIKTKVRWLEYAEEIRNKLPESKKEEFYEILEVYRYCLKRTEDDDYLLQKGAASTRKILLAIGKVLLRKKLIDTVNDVFFLQVNELEDMLVNDDTTKKDVKERILNFKESQKHLPFPILNAKAEKEENRILNNRIIKGVGVSAGEIEGVVYIVKNSLDRNEYSNIPANSIVVAPVLTPNLSYNLITAAGIITEIGGFLSHGAIFAREIQIPAIVAVNNVMSILKNGDKVRMNGKKGTIERI